MMPSEINRAPRCQDILPGQKERSWKSELHLRASCSGLCRGKTWLHAAAYQLPVVPTSLCRGWSRGREVGTRLGKPTVLPLGKEHGVEKRLGMVLQLYLLG